MASNIEISINDPVLRAHMTKSRNLSKGVMEFQKVKDGVTQTQQYVIQWENVIQSFETGILFLMGVIREMNPESSFHKMDADILKEISFKKLWCRSQRFFYDYLKDLHKEKGIELSDEDVATIQVEISSYLLSDTTGVLFEVSPKLDFLRALMQIYDQGEVSKLIFVIDEKFCKNCKDSPSLFLTQFFDESVFSEIMLEVISVPIEEFLVDFRAKNTDLDTVFVIADPQVIVKSIEDPSFIEVTIIAPDIPGCDFSPEVFTYLNKYEYRNEYILFKQKPFAI